MLISGIKKSNIWLCYWLSLLVCGGALANDFYTSAQRITARDGLPETTIFSISRNSRGFVYFGTPTSLVRYDGYEFRSYSDRELGDRKLVVSGAGNIFIDSKDRLWIGTWGEGLVVYDENMQLLHHFIHKKNTPGTLGSNKIQVVFEDSQGDIWIGTNGAGLSLYQPLDNTFINYVHDPRKAYSISHNRIWGITESSPGVLWVATSEGLNRLDTNVNNRSAAQFIRYYPDPTRDDSLNHLMVRSIFADDKGRLWVGTQVDFGEFNPEDGTFRQIELKNSTGTASVTRIKQDNKGNILAGTMQGLYLYDVDKQQLTPWAGANKFQLFPQNDIRDLMVDDSGILWVSTRYAGLIKIDLTPNSFSPKQYYLDNSRHEHINRIFTSMVDSENTIWLGEGNGLLYRKFGEDEFSRYHLNDDNSQMSVTSLAQGPQGRLWVGTRTRLLMLEIESGIVTDRQDLISGIKTKNITAILFDSLGGMWLGSAHDGLLYIDKSGELTHFEADKNLNNTVGGNSIQVLYEDSQNNIWIGTTSNGLSRYELSTRKFYHYKNISGDEHSLVDDTINDILETRDGIMWFATPKSLERFDRNEQKFDHYQVKDGLANANIKALLEDDRGDLWLSSIRGVSQLNRETQIFHNYYADEEVGNTNFLPHVAQRSPSGGLLFGGVGGLTEITPSKIAVDTKPPNIEVTNVRVDNQRLASSLYAQGQVELAHNSKSVQFEFAALDFHRPYENKYKYMLLGVDKKWQGPSYGRTASYTGLKHGQYQFKVLGSNSRNQWSAKPAELTLIIDPAWHQIWWVRILLLVIALGGIFVLSMYRINRVELKKVRLEEEVAIRTAELDEKNAQLANTIKRLNQSKKALVEKEKMASLGQMVAGIAHEVNTPIGLGVTASTLLRQRIEEIRELFDAKKLNSAQFDKFLEESLQNADIIFRNLERAATLVNGFKQVAVDQSSEKDRYFNLAKTLEETAISLSPKLQDVKHKLVINCDKELEIYSKPGALTQIVMNLVLNSLNHAFAKIDKGLMTVDVSIENNNCILVYRDNGCGVPEQIKKTIFDPFVTTRRGKGSTGLGMHLVFNMVTQALGGSIELNSQVGEGMEITVKFPVDVRNKAPEPMEMA